MEILGGTIGKFTEGFNDQQEEFLLSLFVTKPFADVFGVFDTLLPSEQFATLGAAYSRTHLPFQQRLMQAVDAGDLLNREALDSLLNRPDMGSLLRQFRDVPGKAKQFIETWAQSYGHNSIKEMGMLRFCAERIPDYTGKNITGHPLAHPQVQSSRYIDWKKVLHLAENNRDIASSAHAGEMLATFRTLSEGYLQLTELATQHLRGHPLNRQFLEWRLSPTEVEKGVEAKIAAKMKKDPAYIPTAEERVGMLAEEAKERRKGFDSDTGKSVLDSTRYLLIPAVPTSLACAIDARSMEDVLTSLLSSPMLEDQHLGAVLHEEVKKLQPVLMGDKSHAAKSEYQIRSREALERLVHDEFPFEKARSYEDPGRVNFIDPNKVQMQGDLLHAANIAFSHGHGSFMQFYGHLIRNPELVRRMIDTAFEGRGPHDAVPAELGQGGAMREFLMDYGGYRDVFRHRRGERSRQLLSTYHGYETPPLMEAIGQRARFDELNRLSDATFRTVAEENPHVAQAIATYAHKCRTLHTWSTRQDAYFAELRSKPTGHFSYRQITWAVADEGTRRAPFVWSHVTVDRREYPADLTTSARTWYDKEVRPK